MTDYTTYQTEARTAGANAPREGYGSSAADWLEYLGFDAAAALTGGTLENLIAEAWDLGHAGL